MTDTFARMRQLVGTTAEWAANDLIIGAGEIALEKVGATTRMKVGDGVNKFSVLAYFDPGIFSFVLKGGDTMTGPLIVPGLSVTGTQVTVANGIAVAAGNSSFGGPVNLGTQATVAEPAPADNDTTVATTHFVQSKVGTVITGLDLKGTWNAATNTPALASGGLGVPPPERGDFYMVSVAGTTTLDGISTWAVGDSVVHNGVTWQRVPQTLAYDQVVAGLGYVPVNKADAKLAGATSGEVTLQPAAAASGTVTVPNGPGTLGFGITTIRTTPFTASGTWTPHAAMVWATVKALGGGGAGGSVAAASSGLGTAAGGGGAGSLSTTTVSKAAAGASQTVTIGAAGAPGAAGANNGGAGGDASVGTLCVGKGGAGGVGQPANGVANPLGGLGGVAGTGDETGTGAPGQSGAAVNAGTAGAAGGSSPWGGGGRGVQSATSAAGEAATGFGAGGGGATSFSTAAARAGGAGSPPKVVIVEYCTA